MPPEGPSVITRLRCAEGHLHAVTQMVEAGQPCEQVLHQLIAVQAALRAAGRQIVKEQAQASMEALRAGASTEGCDAALKRLMNLYTYYLKSTAFGDE